MMKRVVAVSEYKENLPLRETRENSNISMQKKKRLGMDSETDP